MVLLDQYPLWVIYLGSLLVVLLASEIGFRIGLIFHRQDSSSGMTTMSGPVVGSMLGLIGFLLAFSIGIVIGQHNERKAMVVTDANAIGTAYLRSSFLAEADRIPVRALLQEYVEVRLEAAEDTPFIDSAKVRSEEIHGELWTIVEGLVEQGENSPVMALFIDSINEMIDVHSLRVVAVDLRLPRLLGVILLSATFLSFLLIGVVSSAEGKRDPMAILIFAMAFIAVFMIIVDLDRPQQGILTVSQTALSDLLQQMQATGP